MALATPDISIDMKPSASPQGQDRVAEVIREASAMATAASLAISERQPLREGAPRFQRITPGTTLMSPENRIQ